MGRNALFLEIDFDEAYAIIEWYFIIDILNWLDLTIFFCKVLTNIDTSTQQHCKRITYTISKGKMQAIKGNCCKCTCCTIYIVLLIGYLYKYKIGGE